MLRFTPPKWAGPYKITFCRKAGSGKPGNTGFFRGLIVTTAPGFPPHFPHPFPALSAVALGLAGFGAIGLPPLGKKGPPAHGTGPGVRGGSLPGNGVFQHGVERENRLPEVTAIGPRPALVQHITGTFQRETAVFAVIVGAPVCDELSDRPPLVAGQLPAHQDFGPTWPEVRDGSTIRARNFFLHRFGWPPQTGRSWQPSQGFPPLLPG